MVVGHTGDAAITPEALAALKARIGIEYPAKGWNQIACKDAIRHFAEGLGDDNPLWCDEDYAQKTRYAIIAPPTFLYSCSSVGAIVAGLGLPGVFALYAEDDWEFFQPVLVGDEIRGVHKLVGVEEKPSRWGGRSVHQFLQTTYYNQRGEAVAQYVNRIIRAERTKAREHGKYEGIGKYRYTEEELARIEKDYDREERRGANPRYWEDVQIGDDTGQVVKGPLTVTDMVTWLMGWGSPFCKAHRIAHIYMRKHPGVAIVDPETGVRDFPEAAHWDEALARRSGVPTGYDIGFQRVSWFAHLMTNWMGDDGFLKKLRVQLREPNYLGDTTWIRGRVTRKYAEGGERLVECELWGENQRGRKHSVGWATVSLPAREP